MGLKDFYSGKRVFLTGHTGFKGAWLAWWLKELGAEVTGYALEPEDARGNLYRLSALGSAVRSLRGDLDDLPALRAALAEARPELVLHLAAQAVVLRSYKDPVGTFRSNALGTVHVLEACRLAPGVRAVLVATTDKCYEQAGGSKPFREGDALGGHDPYSASKAMAELAASAYRRSFFAERGVGCATARAGNVVGGGDFAAHRVIPDLVEAVSQNRPVVLRNPGATRPWQHVLDALHGYLVLLERLASDPAAFSGAYNFGPRPAPQGVSVLSVAETFIRVLGRGSISVDPSSGGGHEAPALSLDPGKAEQTLGWRCRLSVEEAVAAAARWYQGHLADPGGARQRTLGEIRTFMEGL